MIQRIQSVWLLLAAICNAGLFIFPVYRYDAVTAGVTARQGLRVNDDFLAFLLAIIITLLPFIAIFLFKQRKNQRLMAVLGIVLNIGFLAYMLMRVSSINAENVAADGTYWIGSVLPIISTVFLVLAMKGINKDEKLIKSLDRLR